MVKVDLNSDLGESFGSYTIGRDSDVLKSVTSANIACGFHAGDPQVMFKTIELALEQNVAIGAHPGLPDLVGFGRRAMAITPQEAYTMVQYQVGALKTMLEAQGGKLQHVKPHGALYNMAYADYDLARAIAEAVYHIDDSLILFGLANSQLTKAGEDVGLQVAHEVFADRAYTPEGQLVSRSIPGAVHHDEQVALKQVLQMVQEGSVTAIDGTVVPVKADTICIHGDNEQALAFAQLIKQTLLDNKVEVQSFI